MYSHAFARLCQIPLIHHPTPLLIELSTVRAYKLLHIYSRHLALIIINSGFDLWLLFFTWLVTMAGEIPYDFDDCTLDPYCSSSN